MRKYDNLLSTLEALFSAEYGASPESIEEFEEQLKLDEAWRLALRRQVTESLEDPEFSWKQALWDENCHITNEDSEESARSYVVEHVLRRIDEATSQE
jgi:hypothetical protein